MRRYGRYSLASDNQHLYTGSRDSKMMKWDVNHAQVVSQSNIPRNVVRAFSVLVLGLSERCWVQSGWRCDLKWEQCGGHRARCEMTYMHTCILQVTMMKWVAGRGGFIQSSEDKQLRFWDERSFKPAITYPIEDYIHVRA